MEVKEAKERDFMLEKVKKHAKLPFTCFEAGCLIHKSTKEDARYCPEDYRKSGDRNSSGGTS